MGIIQNFVLQIIVNRPILQLLRHFDTLEIKQICRSAEIVITYQNDKKKSTPIRSGF